MARGRDGLGHDVALGLAVGAVGTLALDVATYLDMAVRGRPSSGTPAQAAGDLAERAGVDLGEGDTGQNRTQGLGALLGYATGLGAGVAYALFRRYVDVSAPVAAVGLGTAVMAGTDSPMVALGLTDPREWGAAGWLSDLLPHLAYGAAAVAAYEVFGRD